MRAPTAAAAPPLEPDGVRDRSHGLRDGPFKPRLAGQTQTDFAGVGFAEDHHACLFQACDMQAVVDHRRRVREKTAAARGPGAGKGGTKVLEQERYPLEWAVRQTRGDLLAAVVIEFLHHRIH